MENPILWDGTYPVRARIIDAAGKELAPGVKAATPDTSLPHIGKEGIAIEEGPWTVRIDLDDGSKIYGHECWWTPLPEQPITKS